MRPRTSLVSLSVSHFPCFKNGDVELLYLMELQRFNVFFKTQFLFQPPRGGSPHWKLTITVSAVSMGAGWPHYLSGPFFSCVPQFLPLRRSDRAPELAKEPFLGV